MKDPTEFVVSWTKAGVIAGVLACSVYPLLVTVPMPMVVTLALAAAFGPLLSVACLGLYHFISAHRKTVSLQIATVFIIVAGAVVNTMLVVQMTVRGFMRIDVAGAADVDAVHLLETAYLAVDKVQLGLDISWDIYVSVGTILLALNMLRHPRFGRIIGSLGILVGGALLSFNLYAFPVPPAEAGSIDLGPLLGLWYLVVTVMLARSIGWLRRQEPQEIDESTPKGDDRIDL
jgi:hypothetical protein